MPKLSPTIYAALAIAGIVAVRCVAGPVTVATNSADAPPPPLSELLSTNLPVAADGTNAPLNIIVSNSPVSSVGNPTAPVRGPKLATSSDLSSSFNLDSSPETTSPDREPGIYLSSPYAMQIKVPGDMDTGMTHSPSENGSLDNPVHNPGLQLKKR